MKLEIWRTCFFGAFAICISLIVGRLFSFCLFLFHLILSVICLSLVFPVVLFRVAFASPHSVTVVELSFCRDSLKMLD